jgi:hypothetical protein
MPWADAGTDCCLAWQIVGTTAMAILFHGIRQFNGPKPAVQLTWPLDSSSAFVIIQLPAHFSRH